MERAHARREPSSARAEQFLTAENALVTLLANLHGMSQRKALALVDLSRSTWHYRTNPRAPVPHPITHRDRHQPHALESGETDVMEHHILTAWAAGDSVDQAFAAAWDQGIMVGSRRSWWRYAARLEQSLRPVKPHRTKTGPRTKPELLATGPNQVWSWDITDFKGTYRGQAFKVYSIIDIFSRKIVGYRVETNEIDSMAVEMFEAAFITEGATPQWVHADSGSSMKSDAMKKMFFVHGITESHSRPYVSNDNPYSESEFRTLKHRKHFPGIFDDLEHARDYVDTYTPWYNGHHRHSGIGLYTPNEVHDGTWRATHARRQAALDTYYTQKPGRFRRPPKAQPAPEWSGINSDGPTPATERLQTG